MGITAPALFFLKRGSSGFRKIDLIPPASCESLLIDLQIIQPNLVQVAAARQRGVPRIVHLKSPNDSDGTRVRSATPDYHVFSHASWIRYKYLAEMADHNIASQATLQFLQHPRFSKRPMGDRQNQRHADQKRRPS
jgi:hypothetical protein